MKRATEEERDERATKKDIGWATGADGLDARETQVRNGGSCSGLKKEKLEKGRKKRETTKKKESEWCCSRVAVL